MNLFIFKVATLAISKIAQNRPTRTRLILKSHSEQDAMSKTALESAYEWYISGPRQRMQPGGKIVLVMTRWSQKDLTGMLLKAQSESKADQWDVVEFPALMDHGPVWPEYWKQEDTMKALLLLMRMLGILLLFLLLKGPIV